MSRAPGPGRGVSNVLVLAVTGGAVVAVLALLAGIVAIWDWAGEYPAPTDPPLTVTGSVVAYVVDGDTVRLDTGEYVRLLGIDAPEADDPCYGAEATTALQTITPPGTLLTLTRDQTQDPRDRYGRTLAYVGTAHVSDAAEQLLAQGAAKTYVYDDPAARAAPYALAQAQAKDNALGLWACAGP